MKKEGTAWNPKGNEGGRRKKKEAADTLYGEKRKNP